MLRFVDSEPVLLVTLNEPPSTSTIELLSLEEAGHLYEQTILAVQGDLLDAVAILCDLLRTGTEVRSAALLPGMPIAEDLWVAMEWRGRIVLHSSLSETYLERVDRRDAKVELVENDFVILDPRLSDDDPERHIVQLGSELVTLYGDLAHPDLGGAIALWTMFGHMPSDLGRAGIAVERDADCLPALVAGGVIKMDAVGGARHSWHEIAKRWSDDVPFHEIDDAMRDSDAPYVVIARLSAHVDPPVRFPAGFILEQAQLNGVQNLAVASEAVVDVQPGPPVLAIMPAYCLNSSFAPPGGQPLRATALRVQLPLAATQAQVWDELARRQRT